MEWWTSLNGLTQVLIIVGSFFFFSWGMSLSLLARHFNSWWDVFLFWKHPEFKKRSAKLSFWMGPVIVGIVYIAFWYVLVIM